ncbi:hypothetical protein HLH34_13720 [Gluconacetobacter azotocaptans]|uniref:Lipoprotein n=1 Tax=Gluconacetobacter azotocaptans TaxID=142834 RepID=A0A7W4JU64_9PROT|nr:hypothetical protein [Gluconacetobacter azotocaptans]MBB2191006.1 hypothetical protein [Gluconacetobacter azotocaptans]MBM9401928.1 hypothetical protein [Gluconacetobacter azotocaptans]GBQ29570.1 hypothetical protein AA13594_1406 [Gluconacetobacter azotocaptans DSM 13594]
MRGKLWLLAAALSLVGCMDHTRPIFGDWHGYQNGNPDGWDRSVALVLEGPPDARHGIYHLRVLRRPSALSSPSVGMSHDVRWQDIWVEHTVAAGGNHWTVIELQSAPSSEYSSYILMPERTLVPVAPDGGTPDLSDAGQKARLTPRPVTAHGYGRI